MAGFEVPAGAPGTALGGLWGKTGVPVGSDWRVCLPGERVRLCRSLSVSPGPDLDLRGPMLGEYLAQIWHSSLLTQDRSFGLGGPLRRADRCPVLRGLGQRGPGR